MLLSPHCSVLLLCIITVSAKLCPDKKSECDEGTTCCKLATGGYGCCPLEDAVCCSDGQHCCPHGYTCDVAGGRCVSPSFGDRANHMISSRLIQIKQSKPHPQSSSLSNKLPTSISCPGGKYQCPDGNTCCPLPYGTWSCCPVQTAVCCADYIHCCPYGTYCDVVHGTCYQGSGRSIPWFEKVPARAVQEELPARQVMALEKLMMQGNSEKPGMETETLFNNEVPVNILNASSVACRDGSSCPDANTCCPMEGGTYGCCPVTSAVCCSDQLHCCPSGYRCTAFSCKKALIEEDPAKNQILPDFGRSTAKTVTCPDKSECPDDTTCCELQSGRYGCCPMPDAVCCSDKLHCCPHGNTCDVEKGMCLKADGEGVPWLQKVASSQRPGVCPDLLSQCPFNTTCCRHNAGDWACCPYPQAVCCADGENCCPAESSCHPTTHECIAKEQTETKVKAQLKWNSN